MVVTICLDRMHRAVVAIDERELFTENVMMGVYTGRLFRASWPGSEDFGIPKHPDQPACLYPA